jgi:hypothetical protein
MNETSLVLIFVLVIQTALWLHERHIWRQLIGGRDDNIDDLCEDLDDALEREEAFADEEDWWRRGDSPY